MKHSGRMSRCPVCNGHMEYKTVYPWTTFPKDVCSRCGYSGSFAIEWDNDEEMADYRPKNCEIRKKEAFALEDERLHNVARMSAILMIITSLLILGFGIIMYFR
jgi:hypothetical protein